MNKNVFLKKFIVFVLIIGLIMEGLCIPYNGKNVSANGIEQSDKLFCEDQYCLELKYDIEANWGDFYNVSVILQNSTQTNIENWAIFLPLDGTITSIWNAECEEAEDGLYSIKNATWNKSINSGESVTFGMIIQCEKEVTLPETVFICGVTEGADISAYSEDGEIWYGIQYANTIYMTNQSNDIRYTFNIEKEGIREKIVYQDDELTSETYYFSMNDLEERTGTLPKLKAFGPGKKIYDGWKKNYYYQKVNDSNYYYVGCNKRYLIKVDGKSETALYNYKKEIDKTRKYQDAVDKACLTYGISVGVAVPIVMVNIALPEAAVVELLVAAINGVGTKAMTGIVSNCYKNHKSYKKVKDYYNKVKKYAV